MDLTEFLAARLDEEERIANAATRAGLGIDIGPDGHVVSDYPDVQDHFATWNPARVIREVEAKRALLATAETAYYAADHYAYDQIRAALAAVYSDHPDYDPAWAPPVAADH